MNRIEKKFRQLKKLKKKAFVAFITAGYPDLKTTAGLILEFDKMGVDILELGVPFSDPIADGLIIQEASQAALKKKTHLVDILKLVKEIRGKVSMPLCLMSYYNPIYSLGDREFLKKAARAGLDGIIIPDLPMEESRQLIKLANRYGLDVIAFIAPTTSRRRIKYIAKAARGFIYFVSLTGTTGTRTRLPKELLAELKAVKKYTTKPVCAGFGISNNQQVKEILREADGVIVGSAIISKIKENCGRRDLVKRVANFVLSLKSVR